MSDMVLGVIGAGIGAFFGGAQGAKIGWSLGSMVGSALFPGGGGGPNQQGPRLGDLKVQSSTYGMSIPRGYGTVRLAGNMIWSKPILETKHVKKYKSGGKGGSKKTTKVTTYTYSQTFAVGICEGPIVGIRKIWANGKLIYNLSDTATPGTSIASASATSGIVIYTGSEAQTADSLIAAAIGAADTPAYRGLAYVVFNNMQLADYGNRTPNLEFEVVISGSDSIYTVRESLTASASVLGLAIDPQQSRLIATGFGDKKYTVFDLETHAVAYGPSSALPGTGLTYCAFDPSGDYAWLSNYQWVQRLDLRSFSTTQISIPTFHMTIDIVVRPDGTEVFSLDDSYYQVDVISTASNTVTRSIQLSARGSRIALRPNTNYGYITIGSSGFAVIDLNGSQIGVISGTALGVTPSGRMTFTTDGALGYFASGTAAYELNMTTLTTRLVYTHSANVTSLALSPDDALLYLVGATGAGKFLAVDVASGTLMGSCNLNSNPQGIVVDSSGMFAYVANGGSGGTQVSVVNLKPVLAVNSIAVSSIVSGECARVGVTGIDVSDLTDDSITGYLISQRGSARAAIEPLMRAFYVDAVEAEGSIAFVQRGGAVAATLAVDDLAAHDYGSQRPATAVLERVQDVELPDEVTVNYMDSDAAYQIGAQYARRLIGASSGQMSVQLPMALSASKAKQVADVLLYDAWQGRSSFQFSTGMEYSHLTPTDVVSVPKGAISYTVRLIDKDDSGGIIKWTAVAEDLQVYSQSAPAPALLASDDTVLRIGPTALKLLDIPLLRDQDDGYFYTAAYGYLAGWSGCQIYKSTDNGASWSAFGDALITAATFGVATTALGTFTQNIFDESGSVTVVLDSGSALSSTTELAVLNGANAALLGDEIIQFRTATLTAANTYVLTGLLRGRRGTEWARSTHAAGDQFLLLDEDSVYRQLGDADEIGLALTYRGVTFGDFLDDAFDTALTYAAVGQLPYSPVLLGGGRDASNNLTLNWTRRTRISGAWTDYADVPLGEDAQSYEVEIWGSASYTTLKRTISGLSAATTSYTAAQQTTDFGSAQSMVYARVYQLSATVGRGRKLEGSV